VKGAHSVIHLGGHSVEGTWDQILNANIIGCYNLFERRAGRRQARESSPRPTTPSASIRASARSAPTSRAADSRYGVSKAFGEALGALYADKHGMS